MLSLHTNAASLSAQNSISKTQDSLSTSMTRLSTGYRINSAMDDAAGLQIATRLKAQSSGMAVAMRNTQNSISMLQTAEGSLNEVNNILVRMKDLATQAADGSSSNNDRTAMGKELSNIVANTKFGGTTLLNTSGGKLATSIDFQIGSDTTEKMTANFATDLTALATALTATSGAFNATASSTVTTLGSEITTQTTANTKIGSLSTAIDSVSSLRSSLGAVSNRLDHVYNNLSNVSTNTANATGRIMDVDFAAESSSMTSNQMLMQASTAMLKQTNSMSSMVMSLLQ
jgi:flagellin